MMLVRVICVRIIILTSKKEESVRLNSHSTGMTSIFHLYNLCFIAF